MQTGIRLQALPDVPQKITLSRWFGCGRVIWNGKCDEHAYLASFCRKFMPLGTWPPIDQTYAQFKDDELTPWLSDCPSQILRNSAGNWYRTHQNFFKGLCKRPKRKKKTDRGSIHLTRELFRFDHGEDGSVKLFIGTKTNNIGYLAFKAHGPFSEPNSLYIIREAGRWFVSFSYETLEEPKRVAIPEFASPEEQLEWLRAQGREWLEANIAGHDRGSAIPVCSVDATYDFTDREKRSKKRADRKVKRLQRQMSRQEKGSKRRRKTKARIAVLHAKKRHITKDFGHKTSRKIIDKPPLINVFDNIKLQNMTRRPKAKMDENGKYVRNGAAAKSGLAKAARAGARPDRRVNTL